MMLKRRGYLPTIMPEASYLLDFRNPEVRKYCTDTVERLIQDLGVSYLKIDYNVTTGIGSDLYADSVGEALRQHIEAVHSWLQDLYARYPDRVIENCGSGGQRMDYGMLALHSLQSTSDQTDAITNAHIASNVASAVTPEQAGMWVYPYRDEREHIIWNAVNGLLLRPYISGQVWDLSSENFALLAEGIACYRSMRSRIRSMVPFWPEGFSRPRSKSYCYGLRDDQGAYLCVWSQEEKEVIVDLSCLPSLASVCRRYPSKDDCSVRLEGTKVVLELPAAPGTRLLELSFGDAVQVKK